MINKKFHVNTEYDYKYDIYSITVDENFIFKKSLELEDGLILDFNEEGIPISIEILDISERLDLSKHLLNNATINMEINCNPDILNVEISFFYKVHEREMEKNIDSKLANNFNIPDMHTELATI